MEIDETALEAAYNAQEAYDWADSPDDEVLTILKAYEAARWRPIEEAPRDGSEILVYCNSWVIGPEVLWWDSETGTWKGLIVQEGTPPGHAKLANSMFCTIDPPPQDENPDQTKDDPHA